jgi:hypothetical protein
MYIFIIKKLTKTSLIILLNFLLISCTHPNTLRRYSPENNESKSKSVLIVSSHSADIVVSKVNKNYYDKNTREDFIIAKAPIRWFKSSVTYDKVVFSIDPGVYVINAVSANLGNIMYNTVFPGINNLGYVNYGAFEIKEGDVAYLDDLFFNWNVKYAQDFILVDNRIEVVKKELSGTVYANLIPKLRKIDFYPVGSKIYLDKNDSKIKIIAPDQYRK